MRRVCVILAAAILLYTSEPTAAYPGGTAAILDPIPDAGVPSAFLVTLAYLDAAPDASRLAGTVYADGAPVRDFIENGTRAGPNGTWLAATVLVDVGDLRGRVALTARIFTERDPGREAPAIVVEVRDPPQILVEAVEVDRETGTLHLRGSVWSPQGTVASLHAEARGGNATFPDPPRDWTMSFPADVRPGKANLTVRAWDDLGLATELDVPFTVENLPPSVALQHAWYETGGRFRAYASAFDPDHRLQGVRLTTPHGEAGGERLPNGTWLLALDAAPSPGRVAGTIDAFDLDGGNASVDVLFDVRPKNVTVFEREYVVGIAGAHQSLDSFEMPRALSTTHLIEASPTVAGAVTFASPGGACVLAAPHPARILCDTAVDPGNVFVDATLAGVGTVRVRVVALAI